MQAVAQRSLVLTAVSRRWHRRHDAQDRRVGIASTHTGRARRVVAQDSLSAAHRRRARTTASSRRAFRCLLNVRDTGEGITPEFLPHVFERFTQLDGTPSRQHGGLGLGLAIVRHLAELHGGSVAVSSPGPGQGATFFV